MDEQQARRRVWQTIAAVLVVCVVAAVLVVWAFSRETDSQLQEACEAEHRRPCFKAGDEWIPIPD